MKENDNGFKKENSPTKQCFSPEHILAFYTLMTILTKIKKEQGLEAMLEYMANFITTVNAHNPQLSQALAQTIQHVSTGVIYDELGKSPHKNN